MERLTFEGRFCDIAKCTFVPGGSFCESGRCSQRKVWERLKAYEDIGSDPEQISVQLEILRRYSEAAYGIGLKRLRELAKAEKDGRLVVLPVKAGGDVWTNVAFSGWYLRKDKRPYRARVVYIGLNESEEMGGGLFNVAYCGLHGYMMQFSFADIGKTVFLTRQEAEEAMRREGEK